MGASCKNPNEDKQNQLPVEGSLAFGSNRKNVTYVEAGSPTNEPSVSVVAGWISSARMFKPHIQLLSDEGERHSICFDLHAAVTRGSETQDEREYGPAALQRLADIFIECLEKKGIRKTNIAAFSMGAVVAMIAAKKRPELFQNIVLGNPAGFIENDSLFKIIPRYVQEGVGYTNYRNNVDRAQHIVRSDAEHLLALRDSKSYLTSNPIEAARQVSGMVRSKVFELIPDLQDEESGSHIKVGVIHSDQDKIFPLERVRDAAIRLAGIKPEDFTVIEGYHAVHLDRPEEVCSLIEQSFAKMDAERELEI